MAIFESAAFVTLKQSFGNLTTYRSRGMNILRFKTKQIRNPRTQEQRVQRTLLTELVRLSRGFRAAHALGFPKRPIFETTYNTFVRLNAGAVTVGEDMAVSTDYSALVCSQGSRTVPAVQVSIAKADGQVNISGEPGGLAPDTDGADRVYVFLYESGLNAGVVHELGERSALEAKTVALPEGWDAEQVHAYAFVCSASKRIASGTKYVTVEVE